MGYRMQRHRLRRVAQSAALVVSVALFGSWPAAPVAATPMSPSTDSPSNLASYSNVRIGLVRVMSGLTNPVLVANAGDGTGRLFIVEQRGIIKIYKNGSLRSTPFLDMRSRVASGGERGLLGLAFHPNYETNRRFYVFFTEAGTGDLIVARYRASLSHPNRAVSSSFHRLLRIGHRTYANHNGGMLAFGPDGYLYIGTGDGGGTGDPSNHAQSRKSRLGKILRIDVNGTQGSLEYRIPPTNPYATSTTYKREIWSRGLRNPWRFAFDRLTGDLWIGDVGQNRYEEVDRALRSSGGGRAVNYGWHVMEGYACYDPPTGCSTTGKKLPLTVYSHADGCAIIGGYVYRGSNTLLRGAYLFADLCSRKIWSVVAGGASQQTRVLMADTSLNFTSFGQSEAGGLYLTAENGNVYRITAALR